MSDLTTQYGLPAWVYVRHERHVGYFLEDERGRWFAIVRQEWQIQLVFELLVGITTGVLAAHRESPGGENPGPGTGK